MEINNAAEVSGVKAKKRGGKNKLFLFISGGVLLVALVVSAVLLLSGGRASENAERVMEFGTVMQGVRVGGVDISGMTREEALAATSSLQEQMLAQISFPVDINGETLVFTAEQFALSTDYNDVIEKAVVYGRTGTFDERLAAAGDAKETGVDFDITVLVDETALKTALATLKSEMDTPPIDATAEFAPWGYIAVEDADGAVTYTKFEPDVETLRAICAAHAKGKQYDKFPALVRLADEEKPNALRYQYWNEDHYQKDYIPADWNIARFIYTGEVTGLVVDTGAIFDAVVAQVQSGVYETIVPPTEVTPAAVTLEDIKAQTQLVSSWTSSYREHHGSSRTYNVAMIAALLNGGVIEPGEIWSVNDTAGPRNATTAKTYGWRQAAGIENGGYTPQYGGGVCQLGSTVFNAAIRAGLSWTEHVHHSIPSGYVPLGLDSTLDSPRGTSYPGKDLKLKNDFTTTAYIVTYVNPTAKNVTVEVYGTPLTDASGQQIVLDFSFKNLGRYGSPSSSVKEVVSPYECPDGTMLSYGGQESYQFAKESRGTIVQTYKHTYALDGTQIGDRVEYEYHRYPVINGIRYVLKAPTPSPSPSTSPSAPPTDTDTGGTDSP